MTLNDLEPQKYGFWVNFFRFEAATHISRVNYAEIAGDRFCRLQYTFEIDQDNLHMKFSALNVDINSVSLNPLGSRSPTSASTSASNLGTPFKTRAFCHCRLI